MDFVNLLHTFEDTLYEVVMWVVLLPKTFLRVLVRPGWIQPYVTSEWEKKPAQRFQGYLSPMLFWFLLGILPYAVWNPNFDSRSGASPIFVGPVESTFLINAFALIVFPTYYAVVLQRLRREPIEREAIRRLFYIECYVHTPIALFGVPLAFLFLDFVSASLNDLPAGVMPNLLLFYAGLLGLWIVLVEAVVFRAELKTNWPRALGLSLGYSLAGLLLMGLFVVVFSVLVFLL